jgi:FkbM family methyltransferase
MVNRTAGIICTAKLDDVDLSFFVADPEDVIQSCHYRGRFYEPEELDIIKNHFSPGDTFVDIGANVGNHTVFVALFLSPGEIIIFEPNPGVHDILLANLKLNDIMALVDISTFSIGIGATEGEAIVQPRYSHNVGATQLRVTGTVKIETDHEIRVRVRRGDDVLANRRVDFIKIDVEGMEMEVLDGLEKTLEKNKPRVFIECDARNEDKFREWLDVKKYRISDQFSRYEGQTNYMAVPIER